MVVMLLMVFGAVSVSFGAKLWLDEENYQKLKAEVEQYGGEDCKWSEDGKKLISGDLCEFKKILMFFEEIRATDGEFKEVAKKVKEKPLFKEDYRIRNFKEWTSNEIWWKSRFSEWEYKKIDLGIDGARRDYWKKMAE